MILPRAQEEAKESCTESICHLRGKSMCYHEQNVDKSTNSTVALLWELIWEFTGLWKAIVVISGRKPGQIILCEVECIINEPGYLAEEISKPKCIRCGLVFSPCWLSCNVKEINRNGLSSKKKPPLDLEKSLFIQIACSGNKDNGGQSLLQIFGI